MDNILSTRGQLERQLSQTLQSLYRQQFGHLPSKIVCHLFDDKLAIVAEDTITDVEKMLLGNAQANLAYNVRSVIDKAFTIEIEKIIVDILKVEIIDSICDSVLDTGYVGIIVFLSDCPQVRIAKTEIRKAEVNFL